MLQKVGNGCDGGVVEDHRGWHVNLKTQTKEERLHNANCRDTLAPPMLHKRIGSLGPIGDSLKAFGDNVS